MICDRCTRPERPLYGFHWRGGWGVADPVLVRLCASCAREARSQPGESLPDLRQLRPLELDAKNEAQLEAENEAQLEAETAAQLESETAAGSYAWAWPAELLEQDQGAQLEQATGQQLLEGDQLHQLEGAKAQLELAARQAAGGLADPLAGKLELEGQLEQLAGGQPEASRSQLLEQLDEDQAGAQLEQLDEQLADERKEAPSDE